MAKAVTGGESQTMTDAFALSAPALRVAPSLLAADFSRLAEQVERVERAGARVLHLDVMDGHFVPNITIGPGVIASLRGRSEMFFDAHLMIEEPARYAEAFAAAGSDLITFHVEVTDSPRDVIAEIRRLDRAVGVALNPDTPVSAVEAFLSEVDLVLVMSVWPGFGGQVFIADVLEKVRELRGKLGPHQRLEIDGGIGMETIGDAVRAGADTFVVGTSLLDQEDPAAAYGALSCRAEAIAKEAR